jgi:ring-1,2-phenylacetyl-CoA epoxidase subunit PaaE
VLSRATRDVDLLNGRIDGEKVRAIGERLVPLTGVDEVFLCGPQSMIESVKATLTEQLDFPAEHVHFELFGTEDSPARAIPVAMADQGPLRKVTVIADGKKTTIDLSTDGMNILDAALGAGADLPFACKGGVCCTCRAKLVEGEVKMDVNYALEPQEVEQGYILTCQSHPVTDHVTVDYDTI